MTRNVYLGADLTPAILAPTLPSFVAANGQILRDVTANDFRLGRRGWRTRSLPRARIWSASRGRAVAHRRTQPHPVVTDLPPRPRSGTTI